MSKKLQWWYEQNPNPPYGYRINGPCQIVEGLFEEESAQKIVLSVNALQGLDPKKLEALVEAWERGRQFGNEAAYLAWQNRVLNALDDFLGEPEDES